MQRVSRASAAPSLPAPPAGGTPGYFTGGNPGAGQPATVPGYEWFNAVQEEIIAAILDGGQTANSAVLTQLATSIRRLAAANVASVTGSIALSVENAGVVTVNVAAAATITLPAANAAGGRALRFVFIRGDATANAVTIQRSGTDTIEGQTSILLGHGQRLTLTADGASNWRVVSAAASFSSMQIFTGSGTFDVPSGVYRVRVTCTGAGGGGAGSSAGTGGGGGGAGATAIGWYSVTPGQSIPVTVGAAGAAGASGGGAGGIGGTSSFGVLCSATGGTGGTVGAGAGGGGTASGGQANAAGGNGAEGSGVSSGVYAGVGGASFWGGGGRGGTGGVGGGQPGQAFGSGGGGSYGSAGAGGAGRAGVVMVEW